MNAQTYQNRTCELVFAGLERATDFEDVRQFCIVSQKIVHQAEAALFGVKSLLDQSLGEILFYVYNFKTCFVAPVSTKKVLTVGSLVTSYVRRRIDGSKYPLNISDSRLWMRLGFISLCRFIRCLQSPTSTISPAFYSRVGACIDELFGAVVSEILSYHHAKSK